MLNIKKKLVKNLCLMGLMGSGKTSIGRNLSKLLNLNFIDTDHEIEKEVGQSINNIFLKFGESYFRMKEQEICLKCLDFENYVISLGGGSIMNSKIRDKIKRDSFSVYLNVNRDILLKRLKNTKNRPLLNLNQSSTSRKNIIEKLYNERIIFYNKADIILENNFDKNQVIENLQNIINYNEL